MAAKNPRPSAAHVRSIRARRAAATKARDFETVRLMDNWLHAYVTGPNAAAKVS